LQGVVQATVVPPMPPAPMVIEPPSPAPPCPVVVVVVALLLAPEPPVPPPPQAVSPEAPASASSARKVPIQPVRRRCAAIAALLVEVRRRWYRLAGKGDAQLRRDAKRRAALKIIRSVARGSGPEEMARRRALD
jgi:hypothetical protein